jgi:hypothetical protein
LIEFGRLLIFAGLGILLLGGIVMLAGRLPGLDHLPGTVLIQRGNFTLAIPVGAMIVASILATIVLNLVVRLFR